MEIVRDAFSRKLYSCAPGGRRWANYDDLNGLQYAPRLGDLRREFLAGQLGERTGARSAAWREVLTLSKAAAEILELYLAVVKTGHAGTIAEQSEIARHVDRLISKCRLRKARYGLRELVDGGWLVANPLPTGRHKERSNGRWTTCQVVQYTVAPKALSLLGRAASGGGKIEVDQTTPQPPEPASKRIAANSKTPEKGSTSDNNFRYPAIAAGGGGDLKRDLSVPPPAGDRVGSSSLPGPVSSSRSSGGSISDEPRENPRQSLPTIVREERTPPEGVQLRPVDPDENDQLERLEETGPGNEDDPTRSPATIAGDPRTSSRGHRACGAGSRQEAGSRFRTGSRRWRRGAPRTWQHGRRALLEDLADVTAGLPYLSGTERAAILAAAAVQTMTTYRRELGTALDWAPLVLRWLDLPRLERVDEITARIVPALRAALVSPEAVARDRDCGDGDRERRIVEGRRELLDAHAPPRIAVDLVELQELRERLYLARAVARGVAAGRYRLEDMCDDVRHLVERCAEVFGPLVGEPLAGGGVRGAADDPGID